MPNQMILITHYKYQYLLNYIWSKLKIFDSSGYEDYILFETFWDRGK